MASAVPFIAQVIVSVVVSRVATTLAQKIGFSDELSGLIGMGAGLYAGAQVPGGVGGPPKSGDGVGVDLNAGMEGIDNAGHYVAR